MQEVYLDFDSKFFVKHRLDLDGIQLYIYTRDLGANQCCSSNMA